MADYHEAGSIVEFQGKQYKVVGVSIGDSGGVEKLNGYDLSPVGGGPPLRVESTSDLTLISAPPPHLFRWRDIEERLAQLPSDKREELLETIKHLLQQAERRK